MFEGLGSILAPFLLQFQSQIAHGHSSSSKTSILIKSFKKQIKNHNFWPQDGLKSITCLISFGIKELIIFDIRFGIDFGTVLAPFGLRFGPQNEPNMGTHTCVCAHVRVHVKADMHMYTAQGRVRAFWGSKSTPRGSKKLPQERPRAASKPLSLQASKFSSLKDQGYVS